VKQKTGWSAICQLNATPIVRQKTKIFLKSVHVRVLPRFFQWIVALHPQQYGNHSIRFNHWSTISDRPNTTSESTGIYSAILEIIKKL